jgi:hypothetical protein
VRAELIAALVASAPPGASPLWRQIAVGLHEGPAFAPKLRPDGQAVAYGVRVPGTAGATKSLYFARMLGGDEAFRSVWPSQHPSFRPKEGTASFSDLVRFEWHPDGRHNAMVARHKQDGDEIFVEQMRLRFGGEGDDEHVAFSWDGARVAATVRGPLGTELWWAPVADDAPREQVTWTRDFELWPAWDPGGGVIVHEMFDRKQSDLFVLDVVSLEQRPVVQLPASDELRPTYTPDGSRIVFLSDRLRDGRWDLYAVAPGASLPPPLVEDVVLTEDTRGYSVSADGGFVAVLKAGAEGAGVVVVRLDGTSPPRPLLPAVHDAVDLSMVALASGGARLAFAAPEPGRPAGPRVVWIADVSGAELDHALAPVAKR